MLFTNATVENEYTSRLLLEVYRSMPIPRNEITYYTTTISYALKYGRAIHVTLISLLMT